MPRQEFPKSVRNKASIRASGKCEKCGAVLKTGEGQADHILPDGLGGKPTLANCQWLCNVCHLEKTTKHDIPKMCKADRQSKANRGVTRPVGQIKSRGFPKASKPLQIDKSKIPPLPRRSIYATQETV